MAELDATKRTVEDVRREASELLQEMRKGKDPKAHRGPDANVTLRKVSPIFTQWTIR